ncbi:MAG: hypothetical protein AAF517_20155, partial [Planctomycetota bacterium]
MLTLTFLVLAGYAAPFTPPDAEARSLAIGITKSLSHRLQRAFRDEPKFFLPVEKPGSSDWLARHREAGQTFEQFRKAKRPSPSKNRSRIYFLPIGTFDAKKSPNLKDLEAFAEAYFG